ncbi:MAG: hypothetical protein MZU95_12320 [Desulfomicrobium escambiense]|nr:hypothetical protein [Desulfomicrobium escambiense]
MVILQRPLDLFLLPPDFSLQDPPLDDSPSRIRCIRMLDEIRCDFATDGRFIRETDVVFHKIGVSGDDLKSSIRAM